MTRGLISQNNCKHLCVSADKTISQSNFNDFGLKQHRRYGMLIEGFPSLTTWGFFISVLSNKCIEENRFHSGARLDGVNHSVGKTVGSSTTDTFDSKKSGLDSSFIPSFKLLNFSFLLLHRVK